MIMPHALVLSGKTFESELKVVFECNFNEETINEETINEETIDVGMINVEEAWVQGQDGDLKDMMFLFGTFDEDAFDSEIRDHLLESIKNSKEYWHPVNPDSYFVELDLWWE